LQIVEPSVLAASGMDYLAMGGYHEFTCLRLGSSTAVWPGTPEGRRCEQGDLGQKSLVIAEIEPGQVKLHREPSDGSVLEEFSIDLLGERINSPDGLAAAILARSGEKVIARVRVQGPLEFLCDFQEVASKVEARFRFLELVDETELLESGLLRRIEGEHTIRGFFVRRMLSKIEALTQRARTAFDRETVEKELTVSKQALKVGLEQFMEEESANDILYTAPQKTNVATARAAALVQKQATAAENNGHEVLEVPSARARGLLRSERANQVEGEASA
jgi:DNA repair exonuclease SbcCD nuclease subunit